MKRNLYGLVAAGVAAVVSLSACTLAPASGASQGSAAPDLQGLGPGGIQGQGPHGADPNAYYRRLSSVEQGGR